MTAATVNRETLSEYDRGLIAGVLIGEGSFGFDRSAPQVQLSMHVRHETLMRRVTAALGGKLYGPYRHDGRHYFRMMLRGGALRDAVPLLDSLGLDACPHVDGRWQAVRRCLVGVGSE